LAPWLARSSPARYSPDWSSEKGRPTREAFA
jgi:hypothetical protein